MTSKEKDLLRKDLLARLFYGVHCIVYKTNGDIREVDDTIRYIELDNVITYKSKDDECFMLYQIKPYLRPMNTMTEEEARTIFEISGHKSKDILQIKITDEYLEAEIDDGCCSFERHVIWYDEIVNSIQIFDFLVSNHFDYRGLIPMGLASPAPEGMYNN